MHRVDAQQRLHPKNSVIFAHRVKGAPPLMIDEGVARMCIYLPDGQRIVSGFAFAGEVVGMTKPLRAVTVEAATATWTHEWILDDGAETEEARMLEDALEGATAVLALRSRHQAHARLAAFLLGLSDRGFGPTFVIPVSRIDLGDHLGMTVHTISRILSDFRLAGLIEQSPDRVITLDRSALEAVADDGGHQHGVRPVATQSDMVH